MGLKDWLDIAAAAITIGGFLFAIVKSLQGRANPNRSPSGAWAGPYEPAMTMWRWGLGMGLLASGTIFYVADGTLDLPLQVQNILVLTALAIIGLTPIVAGFAVGLRTDEFRFGMGSGCIAGFFDVTSLVLAFWILESLTGDLPPYSFGEDLLISILLITSGMIAVAILSTVSTGIALLVAWLFT